MKHVFAKGCPQIESHLKFRDLLRHRPDLAERYGHLKESLQKQFPTERELYTAGKDAFIKEILQGTSSAM